MKTNTAVRLNLISHQKKNTRAPMPHPPSPRLTLPPILFYLRLSFQDHDLNKKLLQKKRRSIKSCMPPGILGCTVPASVPISVKTSGPQALTGPKASGLNKRLVSASICFSVHGRDISLKKKTATLQGEGNSPGLYISLRAL